MAEHQANDKFSDPRHLAEQMHASGSSAFQIIDGIRAAWPDDVNERFLYILSMLTDQDRGPPLWEALESSIKKDERAGVWVWELLLVIYEADGPVSKIDTLSRTTRDPLLKKIVTHAEGLAAALKSCRDRARRIIDCGQSIRHEFAIPASDV